jgi:hypothetical protein
MTALPAFWFLFEDMVIDAMVRMELGNKQQLDWKDGHCRFDTYSKKKKVAGNGSCPRSGKGL